MQTTNKNQEPKQQIQQTQPTQQNNQSQMIQQKEQENANKAQAKKQSTLTNALTQQQQILLQNFHKKPFAFVPPPIYTDITTTQYRDNMQQVILPYTNNYQMFSQLFDIRTGHKFTYNQNQTKQIKKQISSKSPASLKVKVHNLKFLIYTMYTQMGQILKIFGKQDVNGEKTKNACGIIKHKVQDFYKQANQIKLDYRRIQVIHMLEKEIQYLNKQTKQINDKVASMEQYVAESLAKSAAANAMSQ